jgi:site-specific recombinase XerC
MDLSVEAQGQQVVSMPNVPQLTGSLVGDWQAYLALQVQAGKLTETMKRTYEWGFIQFVDWVDHQGVEQLNGTLICTWIDSLRKQGHNSFSIQFWVDCVMSFFEWAAKTGEFPNNPINGLQLEDLRHAENSADHIEPFTYKNIYGRRGRFSSRIQEVR